MADDKIKTEEDYLREYLGGSSGTITSTTPTTTYTITGAIQGATPMSGELNYITFDTTTFPCGDFYPEGTLFKIRPATVKEIQYYSMVDENNIPDILDKMNYMLYNCVKIRYVDGRTGTSNEIIDQDRLYILFLIRELTFQSGNSLTVKTKNVNGGEVNIELRTENFNLMHPDVEIENYFNNVNKSYDFELTNGEFFSLKPPTIGLQKCFQDYITSQRDKKPNLSFLKIIPFLLDGRSYISAEGIEAKLEYFENLDDISFQFLNSAVGKIKLGIKNLKKVIDGEEVIADFAFPNGAGGIFVIPDAFDAFIKK